MSDSVNPGLILFLCGLFFLAGFFFGHAWGKADEAKRQRDKTELSKAIGKLWPQ